MKDDRPIFITGGAGFIGSALVRRLVLFGYPVALLLKTTTDTWRIADLMPRVRVCIGNLTDILVVEKFIHELQPRGVFHLAASNIKSGLTAPDEELTRVNFLGTVNLLRALDNVPYQFFINVGSFLEYGLKSHPLVEVDRCEPEDVYSTTKLATTLYCQAMARRDKKPIIILRLFSPYGPAMEKGRLIYEAIIRSLRGEELLLTRPNITRDFIFLEDIVDALMEAMTQAARHGGEVYNIGTGVKTSLAELIQLILHKTKSASLAKWGDFHSVVYDSEISQADTGKTVGHFNFRPTHTLAAGLDKTLAWYRERL